MADSRMTAKEKTKMRRLELENQQLRAQHTRQIEVYRDQALELIELRAKLDLLREVMNG